MTTVTPAPGQSPLRDRLRDVLGATETERIAIIPAEKLGLHRVDLPIRGARQRLAALPFALEEQVADSIDSTHFALCGDHEGASLAAVLSVGALTEALAAHPDKRLLPEILILPPPAPTDTAEPTWSAFRDGARVLVRKSDGSGFAARVDMLPQLWRHAGSPLVYSHGAALPSEMSWREAPADQVRPDAKALMADLRQGAFAPSNGFGRPLRALVAAIVLAAIAHMGLAYADLVAQRRLADTLKQDAETLLAARIPEATVFDDPARLMATLGAGNTRAGQSEFLTLFEAASEALLGAGPSVNLRRLVWAGTSGALTLQVEAAGLEDIQTIETVLRDSGLEVQTGTATAAQGGAQAELILRNSGARQ